MASGPPRAEKPQDVERHPLGGIVRPAPLGFLVKGKKVEVDAGTEYTIFIDGDRALNLKSEPRN